MIYDKTTAEEVKNSPEPVKKQLSDYQKIVYKEFVDKEYYSINELCDIFQVNRTRIYEWFKMNMIDYFSITRKKTIITKTQLLTFLESRHGDIYRTEIKDKENP